MFNISGFSPQLSTTGPAREAQGAAAQAPAEAPTGEPLDAFLPSEGLEHMAVGDRGALVRADLEDRDFLKWETEHFVFHYLAGTEAEKDIEEIAGRREQAFSLITSFLAVETTEKTAVYLFPTDRDSYCPTWKRTFAGRTIPEARMIGLAYTADEGAYEKVNIGHELTHALEFDFLPPLMRVPPFFREGIADYLSLSGADMHQRLAMFLKARMMTEPFVLDEEKLNGADYMQSASLVQFIEGQYGHQAFLSFYNALASLRKGEKMAFPEFQALWRNHFGLPLESALFQWRELVLTIPAAGRGPSENERREIEGFLKILEDARRRQDGSALTGLTGGDFYHLPAERERALIDAHCGLPAASSSSVAECIPLGTWGYGATMAVRVSRMMEGDTAEERFFLMERLMGRWTMNPRYPAGWQ